MPSVVLLNQLGAEVGQVELAQEVFGIEPNMQAVYDVVVAERAAKRQGTIRAPQWRGGGIVFGPTPRSYEVKVNRKVQQLAVKSILSSRVATEDVRVVNAIELENYKTKSLVEVLNNVKVNGKVLVILDEENTNVSIAGANIPNVYVQTKAHVSVYDLINADVLVMTEATVKKYEEDLK